MKLLTFALLFGVPALAQWTAPADVFHETAKCLSYRARIAGEYLLVEAAHEPGWHTNSMDNKRRADEKLQGKRALGVDKPTDIQVAGLPVVGTWLQSEPKDASKPELRWFTWIFEGKALFAVKVKAEGAGPAQVVIKAQACSESVCKNIEVPLTVPVAATGGPSPDIRGLIEVRP